MVGGDARLEAGEPPGVAEHARSPSASPAVRSSTIARIRSRSSGVGEAHAGVEAGGDGVVARGPAEDEVDRRQQVLVGEPVDHVEPAGREEAAPRPAALRTGRGRPERLGVEAVRLGVGPAVDERRQQVEVGRALVADEVEVHELDGPLLLDDRRRTAPRTVVIQSASSSAFDTVADRHTRPTSGGRWMITSSHTGPR